jgi:hypothetical protein
MNDREDIKNTSKQNKKKLPRNALFSDYFATLVQMSVHEHA